MYTVFACETVTGNMIGVLPCVIQNWADVMGGTATAEITLAPGALTMATRDNYRNLTTPWRMSVVIDWDGVAVWAGPVIAREFDGSTVKISCQGFKAILNRRKVHNWATPLSNFTVTYTGMSLGQIAIQLVQLATSGSKPGSSLPVVIPTLTETDTDPTHVRTYNGAELKDTGTELDNLTKSLNGPDIHFLPQWVNSNRSQIQWVMRVGTLAQPVLSSAQAVTFDGSAPRSSVQKLTELEDGSNLVTTQWAKGAGNTTVTVMSKKSSSTLIGQGWPLVEGEIDYKTVSDQATLDAHAQADLTARQTAPKQWPFEVNAGLAPVLGSYLLGDNAYIRVKDHVWIPDSPPQGYPARIISIAGDNTPTVKLGVQ